MRPATSLALLTVLAVPVAARAGSSFLVSPPVIQNDEIVVMLGGLSEDGVALRPSSVQVEIDGASAPPPRALESLFEHVTSVAETNPQASSPLAVGVVALWVKEVPPALSDALLEGVTGFLRRLPSNTQASATLYGRKRQPIPKLKASELASDLHDVGFLSGDRPNLADAIRLAARSLAGDESALKLLLVVTDGRDFADPTGEGPADFFALADELARARVQVLLVSFPAPETDAEQSARNLAALAGTGLQRPVDQPAELQSTLESLGQVVADMSLVRVAIPWSWRTWGGTRRLRLNLTVQGRPRALEVGRITLPAGRTPWLLASGGLLGTLLLVGVAWLVRTRRTRESESVLGAASDLIERGVSARRALINLSRRFPKEVASLAEMDVSTLTEAGLPALQSKAGRRRFEEMMALLERADDSGLAPELSAALAQILAETISADRAAARLSAQICQDELARFSRLRLESLASALGKAGERHPILATPRSRALALAIQEALRQPQAKGRSVGWLVRATGPGRRGQTLCLGRDHGLVGRSPDCDIRLDEDSRIGQKHAAISESDGQFTIEALQGQVKVEDQVVTSRRSLHDGDTLEMGESRFVWKCVGP